MQTTLAGRSGNGGGSVGGGLPGSGGRVAVPSSGGGERDTRPEGMSSYTQIEVQQTLTA